MHEDVFFCWTHNRKSKDKNAQVSYINQNKKPSVSNCIMQKKIKKLSPISLLKYLEYKATQVNDFDCFRRRSEDRAELGPKQP